MARLSLAGNAPRGSVISAVITGLDAENSALPLRRTAAAAQWTRLG